jgi:hypothetical protein
MTDSIVTHGESHCFDYRRRGSIICPTPAREHLSSDIAATDLKGSVSSFGGKMNNLMKVALIGSMAFVPITVANAAPFTFGQFDLGSNLVYTDNGAASTLTESSQVQLTCFDPACAGIGTNALLTLSASVSGTADDTTFAPFFTVFDQPLGAGTLTVTLDTPFNGKTNFLTLDFSAGSISGIEGFGIASIQSSGSSTFSSDFLNYSQVGFQLLTDADSGPDLDGNSYLNSFNGSATDGSFFGEAPVSIPEPMTLSIFGAGLAAAAAMRRRKKENKA